MVHFNVISLLCFTEKSFSAKELLKIIFDIEDNKIQSDEVKTGTYLCGFKLMNTICLISVF